MGARSKNDKNDAYIFAELLLSRCLEGIYIWSRDVREMRQMTRYRESLVRKKGDIKREVLAHLLQNGLKVLEKLRKNFTQNHIAWILALDNLILNDKLDIMEHVSEKIDCVAKLDRSDPIFSSQ